ncbi:putative AN1-type zinc finger protein 1 [Paratrimastix pyriformis]|uniref:AN1-type zinc finger protein 1 n=1 Tax=Paratrimastix pyriformis TaxID=342808 RepID=A0ABQ8UIZ9_9EUKA|nr:putative AN1-type zinc finger protein 1 [Paratrimastix pyriformis]
MELINAGRVCALPECHLLDFLPFHCDRCGKDFCQRHFREHSCAIITPDRVVPVCPICQQAVLGDGDPNDVIERHITAGCPAALKSTLPLRKYPCSLSGCGREEIVEFRCLNCHRNYCIHHRHQSDHHCPAVRTPTPPHPGPSASRPCTLPSLPVPNTVSAIAAARVQAIFARLGGGTGKPATPSTAGMKTKKLRAQGNPSMEPADRVYFEITSTPSPTGPQLRYYSKSWTVGKMLDEVASLFHIRNSNHIPSAPKLGLFLEGSTDPLPTDVRLQLLQPNLLEVQPIRLAFIEPGHA